MKRRKYSKNNLFESIFQLGIDIFKIKSFFLIYFEIYSLIIMICLYFFLDDLILFIILCALVSYCLLFLFINFQLNYSWKDKKFEKEGDLLTKYSNFFTDKKNQNKEIVKQLNKWFHKAKKKKYHKFSSSKIIITILISFPLFYFLHSFSGSIFYIIQNNFFLYRQSLNYIRLITWSIISFIGLVILSFLGYNEQYINRFKWTFNNIILNEIDNLYQYKYKILNENKLTSNLIKKIKNQLDSIVNLYQNYIFSFFKQKYSKKFINLTQLHEKTDLLNLIFLIHEYKTFLNRFYLNEKHQNKRSDIINIINYSDEILKVILYELNLRTQSKSETINRITKASSFFSFTLTLIVLFSNVLNIFNFFR